MNKEGTIIVTKDGVDQEIYAIGSFEFENGNEYLLYQLNDEIFTSRIVESEKEITLCDITEEELDLIQELIDSILEGKKYE